MDRRSDSTMMTDAQGLLARALANVGNGFGAVIAAWNDAVGPELSSVAAPVALRGTDLRVRCTSAAWAQSINLMEHELLERLAAHPSMPAITQISARAGAPPRAATPPPAPRSAPARPLPLDPAVSAHIDELVSRIDDPRLRAKVRHAAIAIAQRGNSDYSRS